MAKKEFYFHAFLNELLQGAEKTTSKVIDMKGDYPEFGEMSVMDVPLWSNTAKEKITARAQGFYIQSQKEGLSRHLSFDIVFEKPELKGSTLQVVGPAAEDSTEREWSIVGGTGVFTLAQGVIYGRERSSGDESNVWVELQIHGYYTTMEKPKW